MDMHQREDGRRDPTLYCDGLCDHNDYMWVIWDVPNLDDPWTERYIKERKMC